MFVEEGGPVIVRTYGTSESTIQLAVTGEIDLATVDDFRAAIAQAIKIEGTTRVLVDLSQVSFCDSSGIAALDRAYGEAAEQGIALRVTRPQQGVSRLLQIMGMHRLTGPTA
ncbi:STAS domain-containing protein [Actinoplanes solisilvae]|uniref:STAS domain-containing protein n=1 Tax=Actinoplanes solisilvae TaxID=2486853 RepID=UPI000FDB936E|nr:STAS domain-containing protein [Actinoplanes solisilvae]